MKKIIIISLLLMICISFYEIIHTFAIYRSEVEGTYTTPVGIWSINVNEYDVENGEVAYNYIKQLQTGTSHSSDGKIAPGDTYYFDILINPENTDVAIYYDLSLEIDSSTVATLGDHIKFSNIECNFIDSEENETIVEDGIIKNDHSATRGVIPLSNINAGDLYKIRVYFEWENIEVNNEQDSEIGKIEDADFQVNVILQLKQYLGEELEEYENT